MPKVGVISDTHGYLDPQIEHLFAGVDYILHAGDLGQWEVLLMLEKIAPSTAVLGNVDYGLTLSETELVTLGGRKFLIHHIVDPVAPEESLKRRIEKEKPDVVVFGHTHKPYCETRDGILFFNPGYAGRQRFKLERSVATFRWTGSEQLDVQYLSLQSG